MKKESGFTLVELMIGVAVSGIVMAAMYAYYNSQLNTHIIQDQVAEMQQGLRGAMYCMQREIRSAGCDPTGVAGAGISVAAGNSIRFSANIGDGIDNDGDGSTDEPDEILFADGADNDGDGDIDEPGEVNVDSDITDLNEDITYSLFDADGDGIMDLGRRATAAGAFSMVAENIEAIGFAYAFDADGNSELDTAGGNTIWAVDSDNNWDLDMNLDTDNNGVIDTMDTFGGTAIGPVNFADIKAVKIWILARAERQDEKYYDGTTYVISNQWITPNDGIRRRLQTTTVRCMNMGL